MEKDNKLQQLYMQLQMAGQQIKQMESQMELMRAKHDELEDLKSSIKELKGKALFSIGQGVYAEGEATSSDVILNVGAGVFVKKDAKDALATIDAQIELTHKYLEEMNADLNAMNQQAAAIQEEARSLL